jgi:large conductance mechanosensitive channel
LWPPLYIGVVLPLITLPAKLKKPEPIAEPTTKPSPECLSEIPLAARRYCHCNQPVA